MRNIHRKTTVLESLFIKARRSATLLKMDSNIGISSEYCEIFKNTYFEEHLRTTTFVNIDSPVYVK